MGLPKGRTNNPNGRPPKSRTLTAALESALSKPIVVQSETASVKVSGHKLLAELVTELIVTGSATLPNGKTLEPSPKDWIETVKWVYAHIDGPAKQEVEQSGGLTIHVTYDDNPHPS